MAAQSHARAPARAQCAMKKTRVKRATEKKRVKRVTKKAREVKKTCLKPTRAKPRKPAKPKRMPTRCSASKNVEKSKPGRPRLVYPPALIKDCRRRYEETTETVEAIALTCGLSRSTVARFAKRENWTRFCAQPLDILNALRLRERAAALAEAAQSGQQDHADAIAVGFAEVLAGVQEELANIRALRAKMMMHEPQLTLDAQRAAQTYASLSATLKDLRRTQAEQAKQIALAQDDDEDDDNYDDFPADIDEFRNELARRIDAFVASRTEPDDASGDAAPPVAEV